MTMRSTVWTDRKSARKEPCMNHDAQAVFDTDAASLATLFDPSDGDERLWDASELGAILHHQLSTPLQVDLAQLKQAHAIRVRNLADAQGLTLKSFGDLLRHPHPPVELLKIVKDFAKASRLNPHGPLPRDIASVLYFAAIAAARVRCRRRISELGDAALAEGLRWVLARPWLDAELRELISTCLEGMTESGSQ